MARTKRNRSIEVVPQTPSLKFVPKHPQQLEALDVLHQNAITFLCGPAGTAKAQPLSCKIATPSGFVSMGSLSVGDDICTPDGGVSKVAGVFPQGMKEVYRITFSDGSSTRCCADHLWKISRQSSPGDVVVNTRRLIDLYKTQGGSVRNPNGRRQCNIPMSTPAFMNKREYFIHPYILGCLIGDGCFRGSRIGFASADPFIAEEINKLIHEDYLMNHYSGIEYSIKRKKKSNSPNAYIEELKRLELWGELSLDKHIPEEYLYGCVNDRIALLQGLMDTDGSTSKFATSFGTSSPKLASDVKLLVQSLGGTVTTSRSKTSHADAYKLTIALPNELNPFKLPRKADRVHQRKKYFPRRLVESIELDGLEECQCIFINDGKHLYLTDEFIVTHNTFLASWYAISSALQQQFKKIYVSRPAVTSGSEIGFLPGTAEQKMSHFLQPLYDAREKIGTTAIDQIRSYFEVLPLCYIKGRTIENAILIVDEGQNLTSEEMFNIVTRIGEGGKIVICGDQMQGDLRQTVLDQAAETYSGACISGYSVGMYRFTEEAIVRHPLVAELIKRTMRAAWYSRK